MIFTTNNETIIITRTIIMIINILISITGSNNYKQTELYQ